MGHQLIPIGRVIIVCSLFGQSPFFRGLDNVDVCSGPVKEIRKRLEALLRCAVVQHGTET
jgi:hypothetical protein